ncbi:hypothetical protein BD289DRAFT_374501, partial [Coniella lustricola]
QVRYRLSSRYLILASPFFRAALDGPWKEGLIAADSMYTIDVSDWNEEAL